MLKAYDAKTGKQLWSFDPQVPRELGVNGCCDVVSRGIAAWKGKIYLATFDGRLIAVDAKTGVAVWSVLTVDKSKPNTITGAPRVFKGKVVIGNSGGEYGVRGYISAYDAESGTMAWRFYTVPGNPSKPFENKAMEMAAKTWGGEWWKEGGGGPVWDAISYDPQLNLVYFGVGNGLEWPRGRRSADKGDNLFLSSIVALNADTGEYVWHYQATPGEEWDFDAVQQLTLADLEIDGNRRHVLMQANENGQRGQARGSDESRPARRRRKEVADRSRIQPSVAENRGATSHQAGKYPMSRASPIAKLLCPRCDVLALRVDLRADQLSRCSRCGVHPSSRVPNAW
jgi:quinohemoprotein ethanol dehydrogenase